MTRQELDNLIFASGMIHSIQVIDDANVKEVNVVSLSKALQQVYDIIALIIKDNSEALNKN